HSLSAMTDQSAASPPGAAQIIASFRTARPRPYPAEPMIARVDGMAAVRYVYQQSLDRTVGCVANHYCRWRGGYTRGALLVLQASHGRRRQSRPRIGSD